MHQDPLSTPRPVPDALRQRVLARVARSAEAARAFITVRFRDAPAQALSTGVQARTLYQPVEGPQRPGEPRRVRIVQLAPGAVWTPDLGLDEQSEWLVIAGDLQIDGQQLAPLDFHLRPQGWRCEQVSSAGGASFYLREARYGADRAGQLLTVRDAEHGWDAFAPGIRRRVLWAGGPEAALLYHADPGAQVPRHGHGHDEECLMLDGEVFLDDVLLRPGEYQLAPAGTAHQSVSTDTGLLLFAHGDLELDLQSG